jgi:hypothetical protein
VGIQTGPDRRSAQSQLFDGCDRVACAQFTVFDLLGISAELLSQADRSRVHQVSSTYLDDVPKLLRFRFEPILQMLESRHQVVPDRFGHGDVDCSRNHVVAGLAHIDMIVWMDRIL